MHRTIAVIASTLAILAVMAQGAGLAPHPTIVTHVDSRGAGAERFHWHGFGRSHAHHGCNHSGLPVPSQDDEVPDHVHRCTTAIVSAAPRTLDGASAPFVLTAAAFAVIAVAEFAAPSLSVTVRSHGRWCAGPPPSIRTTRLLV